MKTETGVCFGCGKETAGIPAKADPIILFARKLRALFRLQEKRTVACSACLPPLLEKRKAFDRHFLRYAAIGALFFVLALGASAAQKTLGAGAVFGAMAGTAIIAGFSLFSYCPKFAD